MLSKLPISKQVESELENMKGHLTALKANSAYMNDAKTHISTAVKALKVGEDGFNSKLEELSKLLSTIDSLKEYTTELSDKVDGVDFPERLSSIESEVKRSVKEIEANRKVTVRELEVLVKQVSDVDFYGNFKQLKNTVDTSAKSNSKIVEIIEKQDLPKKMDKFQTSIELLLKANLTSLELAGKKATSDTLKVVQDINFPIRMDKLDASVAGIQVAVMNIITKSDHLQRDVAEQFNKLNQQILEQNKKIQSRQMIMIVLLIGILLGGLLGLFLIVRLR